MDQLTWLRDNWHTIAADPWPFIFVAVIVAVGAFGLCVFIYKERLEAWKDRAEQAERRIAESAPSTALSAPATTAWAGEVDTQFILDEQELIIVFKDGHSFFNTRRDALLQRLGRSDRKTTVMIVHPDYSRIDAVADMDPNKSGKTAVQISDCQFAIRTMHEVRDRLRADGRDDIAKTVRFIGYRQVPVWIGFLARTQGIVHVYSTRPYRGKLPTFRLQRDGGTAVLFEWYRTDAEQLERSTVDSGEPWNLWEYKLPAAQHHKATA